MHGFVDKKVLLVAGLLVWACAKANDSPLGGASYDPKGKAGSSGKGGTGATSGGAGGSSGKGGSSAGGRAGAGGSSATGGSSAAGGGGKGGTGATGGTSGGTGGTGGTGGAGGIDPDVLENSELVVRYIAVNRTVSSSSIEARLFIENKMDVALALAAVTVRYWMTAEADAYILKSYHQGDYVRTGPAPYVELTYVGDGGDSHVAFTFTGGQIPSQGELWKTEFQLKLDGTNGATFAQDDDWSFAPTHTSDPAAPHDKITLYVGETLVWGCEPSGKCADLGMGGAGGQGGEAGAAGAGSGSGGSSGEGGMAGAGQGGA